MDIESCICKIVGEYKETPARMRIHFADGLTGGTNVYISLTHPDRYRAKIYNHPDYDTTDVIYKGSLTLIRISLIAFLELFYQESEGMSCHIGEPQEDSEHLLKNQILSFHDIMCTKGFFNKLLDIYDGCFIN